jgi:hypothetical protein
MWPILIATRCESAVKAKFAELFLAELRRITLPRTPVNKSKKGRGQCLLPGEPHYAGEYVPLDAARASQRA